LDGIKDDWAKAGQQEARHCVTIQAADASALQSLSSCLARHLSMDFRNFSEILI